MKNKNLIIAALVVLVVALAGALAYVTLIKTPGSDNVPLTNEPEAIANNLPAEILPLTCVTEEEGAPVITSLSASSGPVGTKLEIRGCNFSGFEGDLNAWIENDDNVAGILYGESGSTDSLLKVTLASPLCQDDLSYKGSDCEDFLTLTPGTYKIYTEPWGEKSNEATFILQ